MTPDLDLRASLDGGKTWMDVAPCLCDQLAGESCEWCLVEVSDDRGGNDESLR